MRLGDLFYNFTYYTGIHWLVKKWSLLTGKSCGCNERRKAWNDIDIEL